MSYLLLCRPHRAHCVCSSEGSLLLHLPELIADSVGSLFVTMALQSHWLKPCDPPKSASFISVLLFRDVPQWSSIRTSSDSALVLTCRKVVLTVSEMMSPSPIKSIICFLWSVSCCQWQTSHFYMFHPKLIQWDWDGTYYWIFFWSVRCWNHKWRFYPEESWTSNAVQSFQHNSDPLI